LWATVANNIVVSGSVACPDGKVPLGGGFEPVALSTLNNVVMLTPVLSGPSGNGWTVSLRNNTGGGKNNVQFRVWVVCAGQ
jgi:hypothetical protein